jgi:hypothetical protein
VYLAFTCLWQSPELPRLPPAFTRLAFAHLWQSPERPCLSLGSACLAFIYSSCPFFRPRLSLAFTRLASACLVQFLSSSVWCSSGNCSWFTPATYHHPTITIHLCLPNDPACLRCPYVSRSPVQSLFRPCLSLASACLAFARPVTLSTPSGHGIPSGKSKIASTASGCARRTRRFGRNLRKPNAARHGTLRLDEEYHGICL